MRLSTSAVESTVFISRDYGQLVSNKTYRESLKDILRSATMLFVGYSLQDTYLLRFLAQNAELKGLFGDGPHFHLGIGSAKLDFGTAELAGPAFYASTGAEVWSDYVASYVLCGRLSADVGEYASQEPEVWKTVLTFRNTQDGGNLRQAILSHLLAKEGGEVTVAVNGALQKTIPQHILEKARDQFVGLLLVSSSGTQAKPAVWNDSRYSDEKALALWRARSRTEFSAICQKRKIERYDRCPCGSGDKLKFCCEEALRE